MEDLQVNNTEPAHRKGLGRLFAKYRSDRDFSLFLISGLFAGIASGINTSIFNNYLSDVYKISEEARGFLEVPREAPDLFIMVILALLNFLGDIRIAMFGMLAAGLGMLGLGRRPAAHWEFLSGIMHQVFYNNFCMIVLGTRAD